MRFGPNRHWNDVYPGSLGRGGAFSHISTSHRARSPQSFHRTEALPQIYRKRGGMERLQVVGKHTQQNEGPDYIIKGRRSLSKRNTNVSYPGETWVK